MLDIILSRGLDIVSGSFDRMSELSKRIKEAVDSAKKNGHSIQSIATACGVSRQAVYLWIRGETQSIDGTNLVELAEVSGMNARWIINGKGQKKGSVSNDEMLIVKAFRLLDDDMREEQLQTAKARIARAEQQRMNAA